MKHLVLPFFKTAPWTNLSDGTKKLEQDFNSRSGCVCAMRETAKPRVEHLAERTSRYSNIRSRAHSKCLLEGKLVLKLFFTFWSGGTPVLLACLKVTSFLPY